ncbi:hypothetical protein M2451_000810 [Dysgonomonas sp. PFB1-18]|jgi:hypothetical protein|uniref:histone H1 n=1 Tax=unclassified Dysgonomonas TaxID=2630389 RepID=UPI0024752075|nr:MULTISPECIES: histone H1 [unclassified Dysgonomonas]MDH6308499.1 hypothetical protein [Dysgonomonas sp. PF1-14]MDH6338000.1 hypothetical protein [Dysgonomonas sp. PF1-16]MDH6379497.1 hypothetical protein [Dysgonomonas sp. PFB1-18]MDH6396828.1 hypothetical protein [Dysgonomonas sp. PF1-23]
MKNLVEKLNQNFADFAKDAAAQVENGNKAAGQRARKISLEIEKALKDFRKKSIDASK